MAVRRDTGEPGPDNRAIGMLAETAYAAHPEPIPFESPHYRRAADIDGNGFVEGRDELFPMFAAAARDVTTPIFAYGTPRLVRLGVEFIF